MWRVSAGTKYSCRGRHARVWRGTRSQVNSMEGRSVLCSRSWLITVHVGQHRFVALHHPFTYLFRVVIRWCDPATGTVLRSRTGELNAALKIIPSGPARDGRNRCVLFFNAAHAVNRERSRPRPVPRPLPSFDVFIIIGR